MDVPAGETFAVDRVGHDALHELPVRVAVLELLFDGLPHGVDLRLDRVPGVLLEILEGEVVPRGENEVEGDLVVHQKHVRDDGPGGNYLHFDERDERVAPPALGFLRLPEIRADHVERVDVLLPFRFAEALPVLLEVMEDLVLDVKRQAGGAAVRGDVAHGFSPSSRRPRRMRPGRR